MKKFNPKMLCKSISLLMVSMIVTLSLPTAFAANPITLTVANVTQWPEAQGEIYVGQTLGEHITLSGGEVRYDANGDGVLSDTEIVPGHFEHFTPTTAVSLASEITKANLKFVPDDTSSYKGFNKLMSTDVTYTVKKATPVLLDENNPPVATEIKEGQTLSESTITGGTMKNPYNDNLDLSSRVWQWNEPNTVVTESGEYLAKWEGDTRGYEIVTRKIYVEVKTDKKATSIKNCPTVLFNYDSELTWGSYEFTGGIAVITGTDTEVPGTFTIVDHMKDKVPAAGSYEIDIVFTPDDTENYLGFTTTIAVTITQKAIAFVDEDGNPVEDFTFEVEPGTKMNDIKALITKNLRVPQNAVISVEDNNGYAQNGKKYKLTVLYDDTNYTGKDLYFTVSFKEKAITPSLKWVGAGKLKVDCGDYSPPGSFAVYYVIGETETKIGDVKGNSEILEWTPTSSGDYGFKVVYNPIENDYFIIESVTTTNYSHFPEHKLIATGSLATLSFSMGETATVTAPATDPALLDKPYYGFTGWTDVKGNTGLSEEELANETVSFAMPDEDVELTANYEFSIKLYFEWVWQQIVQFFTFIINAVKDLFALATV